MTVILILYFEFKVKVIVTFKIHQGTRIKNIQIMTGIQFQVTYNPRHFNFIGNSGPLVTLVKNYEPIDYFKLFLLDEIIRLMIIETNRCSKNSKLTKNFKG